MTQRTSPQPRQAVIVNSVKTTREPDNPTPTPTGPSNYKAQTGDIGPIDKSGTDPGPERN